jgi:hypothetical protein
VQSLIGIVQTATSPDALEAQSLILRRMVLEGDVVGSRLPPPRNIFEIGGYLNLLGTLKEKDMRERRFSGKRWGISRGNDATPTAQILSIPFRHYVRLPKFPLKDSNLLFLKALTDIYGIRALPSVAEVCVFA